MSKFNLIQGFPRRSLLSPHAKDFQDPVNPGFNPTERELEIIQLLGAGYGTREIANELNLSRHTVATHRKQIMRKSRCRNTTHLVVSCLKAGMI